ncbi:MAG: ABC transporter ATP-binding protein/permease [Paludibacteraceae bacterium]|nr:ABC transporter ATP-binding protein/permease [Paludibacteraceae bacterium]
MNKINLDDIKWLYRTSRGVRAKAVWNCALGTLQIALDFSFIWLSKMCIDIATGKDAAHDFKWAVVGLVGSVLASLLIGYSRNWVGAILGTRSQNMMQLKTFSRLMHNVWQGRESMHTGDSMNRLLQDSATVTTVITDTIPSIICTLLRLCGAFLFLYSMQPVLSVVMLCIAPLFILISQFYIRKMKVLSRDIRDTESRIHVSLQENLQNKMVIKTLGQSANVVQSLSSLHETRVDKIKNRTRFSSLISLITNMGFASGYLVTFVWGAYGLMNGEITYGMMMAFVQLVGQIQGPFRAMMSLLPQIIGAMVSVERIREMEEIPIENDAAQTRIEGKIGLRFKDVTYMYKGDEHPVLEHFSHDFSPGSFTAVLGETGSGKTTMIRLALALIRPSKGSVVLYDGLTETDSSANIRCNMVYVPQGNTLLSGTVRDNLMLGDPGATDAEMIEMLELCCAGFVLESPEGLDLTVGEDGLGLSEGQAQRICIARSLLRKGGILLLDEATSALDQQTERAIIENITRRASRLGQTAIFITHRTCVLGYCDNVVRIG